MEQLDWILAVVKTKTHQSPKSIRDVLKWIWQRCADCQRTPIQIGKSNKKDEYKTQANRLC